jgi:cytoskeletal protein CcmA (bactofilin family)
MPGIDRSGSGSVTGTIKIDCDLKGDIFSNEKGISITGSEYVISEKGSGIYRLEREETVDGGL